MRTVPRVSRHLADTGGVDSGPVGTGEPGDDVAPPPCGTENMVGDLAVGGESSAPLVLYCDSDVDGGTRLAALDGAGGIATTAIDTVVSAVEHRRYGLPKIPRQTLVPGKWHQGDTTR